MRMPPDHDMETRTLGPGDAAAPTASPHLLVIQGASSSRYVLPDNGAVLVGRAPDADLRVDSTAISRRHARFIVTNGEVRVADLESHNGVHVNGERIDGARTLVSGDVISAGDIAFILRCKVRAPSRKVIDLGRLRQRLDEEIERALDYGRPLAVLTVLLGDKRDPGAGAKAADAVRLMDIVGWSSDAQLVVVFPELEGEAARSVSAELIDALLPLAPGLKGGLACLRADGSDADTLLSAVRAAADIAKPGGLAEAAESAIQHVIGDRTIVVADPAMIRLFDLIRRLAQSDLPVLVLGETGAGKENAAAAIHHWSPRAAKPLITLNCATIPENLLESELFGYEKGAFSGAVSAKPGLLERASGGTVFLDEVGELPMSAQAKLLRVLEAKRITRLGDLREREIDIRVVAATNRDLEGECQRGRFRKDLLFRLSAATVDLPPLRQRPREVPILARAFLAQARAKLSVPEVAISDAALHRLATHAWPGNVRELKNAMDYAAATLRGDVVEVSDLPARVAGRSLEAPPGALPQEAGAEAPREAPVPAAPRGFTPIAEELRQLERKRMEEALDATGGVQTRAAELISMPIRTFVLKVKQYGLSQRDGKRRS
jgi:two-component system, NtrC family, response regulator AtoC